MALQYDSVECGEETLGLRFQPVEAGRKGAKAQGLDLRTERCRTCKGDLVSGQRQLLCDRHHRVQMPKTRIGGEEDSHARDSSLAPVSAVERLFAANDCDDASA